MIASLMTSGCFIREESIEIHEDGSASISYQVEGEDTEFVAGDALPGRLGWGETREEKTDPAGDSTTKITWATRQRVRRMPPRPAG